MRQRALITGGSAGIGLAFAEELAATGTHLVLTARRLDKLEAAAASLRARHNIEVHCIAADLEDPQAPAAIHAFTESNGLAIDLLINNAGFGSYGPFATLDGSREASMVRLNCAAVVSLTHLYLPAMIARRSGAILIVSSTAAFQPVPYMAVYAATKAFDLLFAGALAREVAPYDIRVCALCPGSTESDFDRLAGIPTERTLTVEPAEKVARLGLRALEQGRHHAISGFANWFQAEIQRLAPRRLVSAVTERMFRPGSL